MLVPARGNVLTPASFTLFFGLVRSALLDKITQPASPIPSSFLWPSHLPFTSFPNLINSGNHGSAGFRQPKSKWKWIAFLHLSTFSYITAHRWGNTLHAQLTWHQPDNYLSLLLHTGFLMVGVPWFLFPHQPSHWNVATRLEHYWEITRIFVQVLGELV